MNNNRQLMQVIDPNTGVAVERYEDISLTQDPIAQIVAGKTEPPHMVALRALPVDDPESLLATYAGVKHRKLTSAAGSVIELCGAIIWFSGPFSSREKRDEFGEPLTEPGYFTVLLKSTETETVEIKVGKQVLDFKMNVVYRISGKKIAETAMALINKRGWYDWEHPIKVAVLGNQEDGYSLLPMSDRIMSMEVKSKKE